MTTLDYLRYGSLTLLVVTIFIVVFLLGLSHPVVAPTKGMRGLRRAQMRAKEGLFAKMDPAIRHVGGWFTIFPISRLREKIDTQLELSGNWLGIKADEFFAVSVLSGVFVTLVGVGFAWLVEFDPILAVFGTAGGFAMPWIRCTSVMQDRFKAINRGLPGAIDLAALCMGAGLDFPGAIKQIVDKAGRPDDPLTEEFGRILQELELGRTRSQALENFADRAPTEAVKDFVGSVTQAEEKGNPLAEALRIQAGMLRTRRTVLAEENAAKAGVLMILPMMLIFGAILLLLMGPFLIQGMNSGF